MANARHSGTCVVMHRSGWGFVEDGTTHEQFYFHIRNVRGRRTLAPRTNVSFILIPSSQGRDQAADVAVEAEAKSAGSAAEEAVAVQNRKDPHVHSSTPTV
jgi:cold shock CspA family protein